MSSAKGFFSSVAEIILTALTSRTSRSPQEPGRSGVSGTGADSDPGRRVGTETVRIEPDALPGLVIDYSPDRDGAPDAGEVIWTWVPYEENDGRGKDRPVLVIARESHDRVYAVRMTSGSRDHDRDFISIGAGEWDSQGRESWVDVEQLYSVHDRGMRREAAVLDRGRFDRVAAALQDRYGWRATP
ncbi:MAG: type II toxin-antitoxin system PemK/MazF family toxin [Actinomycetota bacterium]